LLLHERKKIVIVADLATLLKRIRSNHNAAQSYARSNHNVAQSYAQPA